MLIFCSIIFLDFSDFYKYFDTEKNKNSQKQNFLYKKALKKKQARTKKV